MYLLGGFLVVVSLVVVSGFAVVVDIVVVIGGLVEIGEAGKGVVNEEEVDWIVVVIIVVGGVVVIKLQLLQGMQIESCLLWLSLHWHPTKTGDVERILQFDMCP
jgi:hypothetical protein